MNSQDTPCQMEAETDIFILPEETLLKILGFLSYKDLARCCVVCSSLSDLAMYDLLWKRQCIIHWNQSVCPEGISWHHHFVNWFTDYGRYIDIYKPVRKAWNQIESFMEGNCPEIYSSLQDGLSEEEIDREEDLLGLKLPNDLRCVYRMYNGQDYNKTSNGLFGTVIFGQHYRSDILLSLQDMRVPEFQRQITSQNISSCIPVTWCFHSSEATFLTITEQDGFIPGQIFYFGDNKYGPQPHCFIAGNSFLEWFTRYAQELTDDTFPCVDKNVYRYYHEQDAVATTEHVRISVATAFMPDMSSVEPPSYVHAYRIILSMDEKVSPRYSCKLETRHWVITDENGSQNYVDGPGVVGEYPFVSPGSVYSYISCTSFKTVYGNMKGTYTMRNTSTGAVYDVVVPQYNMTCLPTLSLKTRQERMKTLPVSKKK